MPSSYTTVLLKQGFPPVPSFRKIYWATCVHHVVPGQTEGYRDEFSAAPGACGQQRRGEHQSYSSLLKSLARQVHSTLWHKGDRNNAGQQTLGTYWEPGTVLSTFHALLHCIIKHTFPLLYFSLSSGCKIGVTFKPISKSGFYFLFDYTSYIYIHCTSFPCCLRKSGWL